MVVRHGVSGAGGPHISSNVYSGAIASAIASSRSPQASARLRSARKKPEFGHGSQVQPSVLALPLRQFAVDDCVLREAKATANVAALRQFLFQQEAAKRADGVAADEVAVPQLQLFNKVGSITDVSGEMASELALAPPSSRRRDARKATTGLTHVQYTDGKAMGGWSARYDADKTNRRVHSMQRHLAAQDQQLLLEREALDFVCTAREKQRREAEEGRARRRAVQRKREREAKRRAEMKEAARALSLRAHEEIRQEAMKEAQQRLDALKIANKRMSQRIEDEKRAAKERAHEEMRARESRALTQAVKDDTKGVKDEAKGLEMAEQEAAWTRWRRDRAAEEKAEKVRAQAATAATGLG